MFAGVAERLTRDHQDRGWLAWHVAALSKWDPKKFPTLSDLTGVKPTIQTVQSADEIRAAFAALRARRKKT